MQKQDKDLMIQLAKYLAAFLLGAAAMFLSQSAKQLVDGGNPTSTPQKIVDFDTCAQHEDSKILESYPARCVTADGVSFVQEVAVEEPPALMPTGDDPRPMINQRELSAGWYWGEMNQKKQNTPADWVHTEGGRSSCWHRPGTKCETTNSSGYTCPKTNWVDCMPGPNQGIRLECTTEYLEWATANCPGFEGAAY